MKRDITKPDKSIFVDFFIFHATMFNNDVLVLNKKQKESPSPFQKKINKYDSIEERINKIYNNFFMLKLNIFEV